ncbi:AAEL005584-PA [Aedes aegypti]|uniref:AAEL005584-PA n=2 Tax=Aedes aegypti TaxID=7159 RepID=A0A1S4FAY7_AEDAE|nr:PR domain zinc finger protein 5 [Aedes aegypti]EAT42941.1 AAEL005584-PA [Aedes aegypti]
MHCTICYETDEKLTAIEVDLTTQHHLCNRCLTDLFTAEFESDSEDSDINFEIKHDPTLENELHEDQELIEGDESFDDDISIKSESLALPDGTYSNSNVTQDDTSALLDEKPSVISLESLKVECSFCGERSVNRKTLADHMRACHPEEKVNRCLICRLFFRGVQQYEEHIRDDHGGFSQRCDICLEGYVRDEQWKHRTNCLGRLVFECVECEERFISREGFEKHVSNHQNSEDRKRSTYKERRIHEHVFTCALCEDDKTYEENIYWNHVHEIHDGHHLRCPHCAKTFRNRKHLIVHTGSRCKVSATARQKSAEINEHEPSKCDLCSKTFRNRALLKNHVAKIHKAKAAVCDLCGLSFANRAQMRYHQKKSHTEPAEKCPHCTKRFHLAADLRQHLTTHEMTGKFVCEECGRVFKRKVGLELHVKSHQRNNGQLNQRMVPGSTGRHACELCDRRFKHNYILVAHMKTHDPDRVLEKKFACKECDKKFATSAGLYCHLKGKYVHQKMTCPVCNAIIKGKERYAVHLAAHSDQS